MDDAGAARAEDAATIRRPLVSVTDPDPFFRAVWARLAKVAKASAPTCFFEQCDTFRAITAGRGILSALLLGPGTLYGSMGRMMEAGLIRESDKRVDPEMDDERRIYYEITGAGRGRSKRS